LAAVAFTPATDKDMAAAIATRIRDAANTGPLDGTITLNVTAVNDAPTATNLTQTKSYTEGSANVALDDIVVSDVDSSETVTATLTLSPSTSGSLTTSGTATYSNGPGVWTITGTVSVVNSALAALAFTPAADNDVVAAITTRVRDAANTGPADGTITLNVTAVNDAPTATNLTQTKSYTEGAASVVLDDIVVSDVDTGEIITATLTLSPSASGSLTTSGTAVYTSSTGVWTMTGAVTLVNTALSAVSFTPATNFDRAAAITTRIRDAANTGPTTGTISLTVTAVNNAPSLSGGPFILPGSNEDTPSSGTLVSAILSGLTYSDLDTGALSGIAITARTGNGGWQYSTEGVTWTGLGTVSGTNALLLAGGTQIRYVPDGKNGESATFTFQGWDQSSGTASSNGTAQNANASVNGAGTTFSTTAAQAILAVSSVNDAPTVNGTSANQAVTDKTTVFPFSTVTIADVDIPAQMQAVTVTLDLAAKGSFTPSSLTASGITASQTAGVYQFSGTAALAQAAIRQLVFQPSANRINPPQTETSTFTLLVHDGVAAAVTNNATTVMTTSVNDSPILGGAQSNQPVTDKTTVAPFTTFTITDVEAQQSQAIVVSLDTAAKGAFTSASLAASGFSAAQIAGTYQFGGTAGQAQAAIRQLVFQPADNRVPSSTTETTTLTVLINDASGGSTVNTDTSVASLAINDAPTLAAIADPAALLEDAAQQTITLSGLNAGSVESQLLTLSASSSNPALIPNPTVNYSSPQSGGTLIFTPAANANGTATITVALRDNGGTAGGGVDAASLTFVVKVTAVNDAPTLAVIADPPAIVEDSGPQTINLSGISAGPGNESQALSVTAASSNPALIPNPTVTYTGPQGTGTLTYTPVSNVSGTALITVVVSDDGGTANGGINAVTNTFLLTVTPVNDKPTLSAISNATILEDAPTQTVNLAGIGAGQSNESQVLTVTASSSNLGLIPSPTVTYTNASPTGLLRYTPLANANGSAVITVVVRDDGGTANGGVNAVTNTFTVTITAVNDLPTLAVIPPLTITEDSGAQTVSFSGVSSGPGNESSQFLTITASSSNASLIPNPTVNYTQFFVSGTLALAPVPNASGVATISVVVADNVGASITSTFTVTVTAVNDAPTLAAISDVTVTEDGGPQTLNLSGISAGPANEAAQSLAITATSNNPGLIPNPSVNYASPSASGTLTFAPVTDAFGTATITVVVTDNGGTANSGVNTVARTFNVIVTPVSDSFTLGTLTNLTILEDAPEQTIILNGIGTGTTNATQALTVTASSTNPGLIPNPVVAYTTPGTSGTLSFAPVANAVGSATIVVIVRSNESPANSVNAVTNRFTVTVTAVNDAPTLAVINNVTLAENAPAQTVTLSGISSGASNEAQTLTVAASSSNPSLIPAPVINYASPGATGTLTFSPAANGAGTATITVIASDDGGTAGGGVAAATNRFTVTVTPVNSAPTLAVVSDRTISEQSTLTFTASAGDLDLPPDALTFSLGAGAPAGAAIHPSTGVFAWTPSEAQGPGAYPITVRVADNGAPSLSAVRTFTVTVTEDNTAPALAPVAGQRVNEGETLTLNLNASDLDTPTNQLTFSLAADAPEGAAINATSGVFTWTPDESQGPGVYTITAQVQDNGSPALAASRGFTVEVQEVNQAPVLPSLGNRSVSEGQNLTLIVAATDSDRPTNRLSYSLGTNGPAGMSIGASTGTLIWTPSEAQAPGTNVVTIVVTDDGTPPLSASTNLIVQVTEVNSAPVLEAISDQTVLEGAGLRLTARATDGDLPANALIFSLGVGAPAGAAIDSQTGELTWTAPKNPFASTNVFTVTVTDNGTPSLSASRSFQVIVGAVNDPPVIAAPAGLQVSEDTVGTLGAITVNDPDAGSGALTISLETRYGTLTVGTTNGIALSLGNGRTNRLVLQGALAALNPALATLSYRGPTNFFGGDMLVIEAEDQGHTGTGGPLTNQQEVAVAVLAVNDAPTIQTIANQTTVEAEAVGPIAFQVADVDNAVEGLKVTGSSSNEALLPVGGIVFAGTGAARTVTLQPASGQTGSATVTLRVQDSAGAEASVSFGLNVGAAPALIVSGTESRAVLAGIPVSVTATVRGTAPLLFQWFFNGAAMNGATGAVLQLPSVQVTSSGVYALTVTNAGGSDRRDLLTLQVNAELGIATEVADVTARAGDAAVFRATAAGTAPFRYQWRFDGIAVAGATADTLSLAAVQPAQEGNYSLDIENAAGRISSRLARLRVLVPPALIGQLADRRALAGSRLTFTLAASGTEPLSYQWFNNGTALAGANGPILVLENAQAAQTGQYRLVVTNAVGSASSRDATLTVSEGLAVTAAPQSQSVKAGDTVILRVTVSGSDPVSYQWFHNDARLAGQTNAALTLTNVAVAQSGRYLVEASNPVSRVSSAEAVLAVLIPPQIAREPEDQTVVGKGSATLSVTASGSEPLSYQWQKGGANLSGATNASLVLDDAQSFDAGSYQVLVSNGAGSVQSRPARLEVTTPVQVPGDTRNVRVALGQPIGLEVQATGTPPLSYEWYFNGQRLAGVNGPRLDIAAAALTDTGRYTVAVRNGAGVASGPVFNVMVLEGVRIVRHPQGQEFKQGEEARLTAEVAGTGPLRYRWEVNGVFFRETSKPELVLPGVQPNAAGRYRLRASNAVSEALSQEAELKVGGPPPKVTGLPPVLRVVRTTDVILQVTAEGQPPYKYQWQRNGVNILGANTDTYRILNVQPEDAGTYSVVVTDSNGAATSYPTSLIVIAPSLALADDIADAVPVSGATGQGSGNNIGASREANEPNHAPGRTARRSVWLAWQSPGTGAASFNTRGSGYDTILAVYTGTPGNIQQVASDEDSGGYLTSALSFNTVTNQLYYIAIDGFEGGQGEINLAWNWIQTSEPAPVIEVQPASRTVLIGGSATFSVQARSPGGSALAYQWLLDGTPVAGATSATLLLPSAGGAQVGDYRVRVSNPGGSVLSYAAILQVNMLESGQEGPGVEAVDKIGASNVTGEQVVVQRSFRSLRPQSLLQGYRGDKLFSSKNAVKDIGEPNHGNVLGGASTWFVYHAVANAMLRFRTEGSDYDTVLAIYTSPSDQVDYTKLAEVASDDNRGPDGRSAVVLFPTEAGVKYYVVVDGVNGATGLVRLRYEFATAPGLAAGPAWSQIDPNTGLSIGSGVNPSVRLGESARWSIGVVQPFAPADLSYQWRQDGNDLPGATNATLPLINLSVRQAGDYSVVVENFAGSTVSSTTKLGLVEPLQLVAGLQPQTAWAGNTVTFSVAADGSGPFTYRWTFKGTAVAGATNAALVLSDVTTGQSGEFAVEVSNGLNTVTSRAVLTVQEALRLLSQPQSQTVLAGGSAQFTLAVAGLTPLSYQWRFNGVNVAGAVAATLRLDNAQSSQAGRYSVVVSNALHSVVSDAAVLTVRVPLAISQPPASQIVATGGQAQFSVLAVGTGPLQYQWRFNEVDLPGASGPILELNNVQETHEGRYQVAISDATTTIISPDASLTLLRAPTILEQPASQTVATGTNLVLRVQANGSGVLRYQWRLDGFSLTGATNRVMQIPGVASGAGGTYTVSVENEAGSVLSEPAVVTVVGAARLRIVVPPQDLAICLGETVRLSVQVEGDLPLSYQWSFNGTLLSGETNATLVLINGLASQSGLYQVAASNATGVAQSRPAQVTVIGDGTLRIVSARLLADRTTQLMISGTVGWNVYLQGSPDLVHWTVLTNFTFVANCYEYIDREADAAERRFYKIAPPPLRIIAEPQDLETCLGETVRLSVQAEGVLPLSYQWSFNGTLLSGATNATLVLTNGLASQSGLYQVAASNAAGVAQSRPAQVTVIGDGTLRIVSARHLADRGTRLMISGSVGWNVFLQRSPDLVHWTVLTNFTFGANCYEYIDREADAAKLRYYKIAPPPLRIKNIARSAPGQFQLDVDGQAGLNCLIRVSADLITWTDLTTAIVQNGKLMFTDPEASGLTYRFYQAIVQP
jgi:hypothetical protein